MKPDWEQAGFGTAEQYAAWRASASAGKVRDCDRYLEACRRYDRIVAGDTDYQREQEYIGERLVQMAEDAG